MPVKYMECGPKCRSRKHAYELNAAISKGSLLEVQRYTSLCYNGGQLCDVHGRSALHMAASCGKVNIIEWLIEKMHGDVTRKDLESGWTALHRAVFYGQLVSARLLIQFKSDLYTRDHEGLGPLDITMKDRILIQNVPPPVYEPADAHEVFTWGDNSNFTLGHSSEHGRNAPEVLDEFRKLHIGIRQVVMCKYHTVFLSTEGHVYTCGHGLGGRLGHLSEETCLVPKLIESMKTEECTEIAAARDHTLILTRSGTVYSCGMNSYHQLGQVPAPDKCLLPKPINCKTVKGRSIGGVCAGRFHTVLYTSCAVFTCGLNAGQLGHPKPKGDGTISQLRQVSWLNGKDLNIVSVKSSDAATVVLTSQGEIYVLHEYQCRKMASNRPDIQRLCVVGGNLDHTDSQILRENGGRELVISYLNHSGKVFIWHEKSPSLKRAQWLIKRQLYVKDFVSTENGLVVVTDLGEVFVGTLSNKPAPVRESTNPSKESVEGEFGKMSLMELLMQEETEEVQVRKVPNIHRAMYVTADRKGRNFATLQSLPNSCLTDVPAVSAPEMAECFGKLLAESDEYDLIHDLILQIHDQRWPVHKYILVNRCANFPSLLVNNKSQTLTEMDIPVIDVSELHPQVLEQLLQFVYTDTCDLLTLGAKFVLHENPTSPNHDDIFDMDMDDVHDNQENQSMNKQMSAFQVVQQNKGKKKLKERPVGDDVNSERNPYKLLLDVAKKWGVKGLAKRLGCVTYKRGQILSAGKAVPKTQLRFERNKLRDTKWELYDVSIQSNDGTTFQCHKCVLVARLEYFHSMLATGWMETSSSTALTLPVPGDILEILLDYLYTDESPVVSGTQNVELLCNILVVADQMLVTRLKEMCEAAIAVLITFKNVAELLEFSTMYNAVQLKAACQQYIVLNLPALLEGRYLDLLSDEVMAELSKYYRQSIPNMSRRMITPYDEGPDKAFLEFLASQPADDSEYSGDGAHLDPKKKSRRKRNRTKSSAEEQEKGPERGPRRASERQISVSSDISVKSDDDTSSVQELSVDCSHEAKGHSSATSPKSPWGSARSPTDLNFKQVSPNHQKFESGAIRDLAQSTGQNINRNAMGMLMQDPRLAKEAGNTGLSSTTSGPSLRDIIIEEQARVREPKTPQSGHKSGRLSWKEIKKQQKSQTPQKLSPQQADNHSSVEGDPATSITRKHEANSDKKSGLVACPWGSVSQVVSSFRNLMVADQQATVNPTKVTQAAKPKAAIQQGDHSRPQGKPSNLVSWGLPQDSKSVKSKSVLASQPKPAPTRNPWSKEPASPRSPETPWAGQTVAQSPPDSVFKFSDIVQDEQQKSDVLTKISKKPLSLIQIEEQAIQDLLKFYKAGENVDEHITVERVTQESATPVWKRERMTSF